MRIVKARAQSVLSNEVTKLSQQVGRCEHMAAKLSSATFDGLLGKSVTMAQNNVRMQAAITSAHAQFFRSLAQADRQNAELVSALPTTSPGVLDTSVAEERAREARANMQALAVKRDEALRQARLTNETLAASVGPTYLSYVNVDALQASYDALIQSRRVVAELNEDIIERAAQYEREAAGIYGGVDASYISSAASSAGEFSRTGSWGNASWVNSMNLGLGLSALERDHLRALARQQEQWNRYLSGDLGMEGSALSGSAQGSAELFGMAAIGHAEGEVLGFEASLSPQDSSNLDVGEDALNLGGGTEASAQGYVAHGSATGDVGELVHAEAEAQFYTMAAAGSLGATLYEDGCFDPSINAGYEASLNLLSHEESLRVGTQDFNVHPHASAEVVTFESSAEVVFGDGGFGVSVEDEAYIAEGTIGSGITFMGVSLDVDFTGKIGGGGVEAGAKVTRDYAQGKIGLGLGLGLGVQFKVDWSGAAAAAQRTWDSVQSWWNERM